MAPTTRRGPNTPVNDTNPNNMTPESVQAMIDQALLRNSTNGDGSHSSHGDNRRNVQTARPCFYADFMKCQPLNFKGAEGGGAALDLVGMVRIRLRSRGIFHNLGKVSEKDDGQVLSRCEIKKLEIELWRKEAIWGILAQVQQVPSSPQWRAPEGHNVQKILGHFARRFAGVLLGMQREVEGNAPGNPDANVVTGTFLLNNHYASILFDTGADRSFISTAFSSLINIAPTSLENCYDVELADGKLVKIDTIIRGCTLNFLDHPFNIDLMPVELGSFDVIIGMDWLRRYHAVIVCDEKLVQVPYGNETLTFCGNEGSNGRESRLSVISCSKAQEYMAKGCQVFLAQISTKKEEDKSERKQIEIVTYCRFFGISKRRVSDKEFKVLVPRLGEPVLFVKKKEVFILDVHRLPRYRIEIPDSPAIEYEEQDGVGSRKTAFRTRRESSSIGEERKENAFQLIKLLCTGSCAVALNSGFTEGAKTFWYTVMRHTKA
ncbi:putative reverse transcriptase domain-containing protein [Tanacetum coccineum]